MNKLRAILLTVITIFGFGVSTVNTAQISTEAAVRRQVRYVKKPVNRLANKNYTNVAYASKRFIGTRYIWGGTTPRGFDCSGFVQYLYRTYGKVNLPRTSQAQARAVQRIKVRDAKAGDLLFWQSRNGNIFHVGISLGNGNFISALNPRMGIKINNMYQPTFAGRIR